MPSCSAAFRVVFRPHDATVRPGLGRNSTLVDPAPPGTSRRALTSARPRTLLHEVALSPPPPASRPRSGVCQSSAPPGARPSKPLFRDPSEPWTHAVFDPRGPESLHSSAGQQRPRKRQASGRASCAPFRETRTALGGASLARCSSPCSASPSQAARRAPAQRPPTAFPPPIR